MTIPGSSPDPGLGGVQPGREEPSRHECGSLPRGPLGGWTGDRVPAGPRLCRRGERPGHERRFPPWRPPAGGRRAQGCHAWSTRSPVPIWPGCTRARTEAVRFRPDGRGFVTVGLDGLAYWPVQFHDENNVRHHVVGPPRVLYPRSTTSFASRAAWGPGGRFLAWSDRPRGQVVIEDVDGKLGRRVLSGITNLRGLAVSPDGRWLATCPWQGEAIEVRDLENEQVVWSQKGDYGRALFSPDGRLLATTMDDKVSFWEAGSWRLLNEVSCTAAGTMAFSPDGSLLAVNSADGIVMLLNPATGETLARLQNPYPRIDPFHLAFSSDGALLAMANGRRGVQVWDLKQVRQTLREIGLDWDWPRPLSRRRPHGPSERWRSTSRSTKRRSRSTRENGLAPFPCGPIGTAAIPASCIAGGIVLPSSVAGRRLWPTSRRVSRALGGSLHGLVGFLGGPEAMGGSWRPVPGRWHHLALTFDDKSGVKQSTSMARSWPRDATTRPGVTTSIPCSSARSPIPGSRRLLPGHRGERPDVGCRPVAVPDPGRSPRAPAATEPQSADLIGRWNPMQAGSRTLADTSGQHHDGRLVGNVSVVPIDRASAPPGLPACRYALRFDGSDGHVEIPDAPGLRPRSFTIEGWFNFARDDRKCWLFSRRVGELFSVSLALGYDDPGTSEKLDVSLSQLYALLAANDLPGYRRLLSPARGAISGHSRPFARQGGCAPLLHGTRGARRLQPLYRAGRARRGGDGRTRFTEHPRRDPLPCRPVLARSPSSPASRHGAR